MLNYSAYACDKYLIFPRVNEGRHRERERESGGAFGD